MKRGDWYIDGDIVEYFGMPEKEAYQKHIEDKREICQDNHVTLIEIYEEDISDLENIFKKYYKNP